MRKRFQQGSVKLSRGKSWVGMWRDQDGHHRSKKFGTIKSMTKTQAKKLLQEWIFKQGVNDSDTTNKTVAGFLETVFYKIKNEKWKESTKQTTQQRINYHIKKPFFERRLDTFTREELQTYLEAKVREGLSWSTVEHLRRDLKDVFHYALAEGVITKNPASLLYTPRAAKRPQKKVMELEDVETLLTIPFALREQLIILLALCTGMRPSELFGLTWHHVKDDHLVIEQRLYRCKIDTPKTDNSRRLVAIPPLVRTKFMEWHTMTPNTDGYVFPTEKGDKPISKDNTWGWSEGPGKPATGIKKLLDEAGLPWVNFQVLRRTHASIMRSLDIHPKTVADQLGHTLDVSQNIYTKTPLEQRLLAVSTFALAIGARVEHEQTV